MFSYGFYNSLNGDRKYDAIQMSSIFDGIIEDGIYSNIGEAFAVVPGPVGLQVIVKTGRAWFKHTWNLNDSWMVLNLDEADLIRDRIDSVIIEVNSNVDTRENSIKIIKGIPSSDPVPPTLIHDGGIDQYRLADVTIKKGAETILEENIANKMGQGDTPFVTCPLKAIDISDLFQQWNGEFNTWFDNIKLQLTENVITNLQSQIDDRVKISDKATPYDIQNGVEGKWIDAKMAKEKVAGIINGLEIGDIVFSTRDLETETGGKLLRCDQRAVKREEYPELCDTDGMVKRIRNIDSGLKSFTSASTYGNTVVAPVAYLGGRIRDGYIYEMTYNTGSNYGNISTEVTGTIYLKRYKIETPTVVDWNFTFSTKEYVCGALYFKGIYVYYIPFNSSQWYRITIGTQIVETLKAEAMDEWGMDYGNTYIRTMEYVLGYTERSDGGIDIYAHDFNFNSITCIRMSPNLDSKKVIRTVMTLPGSPANGYQYKASVGCMTSAYTYELNNCYNGKIAFVVCFTYGTTSNQYVGSFNNQVLYYKNIDDETFTVKTYSADTVGLNSYNGINGSYGNPMMYLFSTINKNYIYSVIFYTQYTGSANYYYMLTVVYDLNGGFVKLTAHNLSTENIMMIPGNYDIHLPRRTPISKDHSYVLFPSMYDQIGHIVKMNLLSEPTFESIYLGDYAGSFNSNGLVVYNGLGEDILSSIVAKISMTWYLIDSTYSAERLELKKDLTTSNALVAANNTDNIYIKLETTTSSFDGPLITANVGSYMVIGQHGQDMFDYYIKFTFVDNVRILPYKVNGFIKAKD